MDGVVLLCQLLCLDFGLSCLVWVAIVSSGWFSGFSDLVWDWYNILCCCCDCWVWVWWLVGGLLVGGILLHLRCSVLMVVSGCWVTAFFGFACVFGLV